MTANNANIIIEIISIPHFGFLSLFTLFLKNVNNPIRPRIPKMQITITKTALLQDITQTQKSFQRLQSIDFISAPLIDILAYLNHKFNSF